MPAGKEKLAAMPASVHRPDEECWYDAGTLMKMLVKRLGKASTRALRKPVGTSRVDDREQRDHEEEEEEEEEGEVEVEVEANNEDRL